MCRSCRSQAVAPDIGKRRVHGVTCIPPHDRSRVSYAIITLRSLARSAVRAKLVARAVVPPALSQETKHQSADGSFNRVAPRLRPNTAVLCFLYSQDRYLFLVGQALPMWWEHRIISASHKMLQLVSYDSSHRELSHVTSSRLTTVTHNRDGKNAPNKTHLNLEPDT